MNRLIVFSSETGNTEKLASAVESTLITNVDKCHVNLAPNPSDYDIFFVGYRLNRGTIDPELQDYFKNIHNKKVYLFGTMGASPESPYGILVKKNIEALFNENNNVFGHFLCQGQISTEIMDRWFQNLEDNPDDIHAKKQVDNYNNAFNHPDETDVLKLRENLVASLNNLNL